MCYNWKAKGDPYQEVGKRSFKNKFKVNCFLFAKTFKKCSDEIIKFFNGKK